MTRTGRDHVATHVVPTWPARPLDLVPSEQLPSTTWTRSRGLCATYVDRLIEGRAHLGMIAVVA